MQLTFSIQENLLSKEVFRAEWLHAVGERLWMVSHVCMLIIILLHVTVQRLLFACYSGDELRPLTDC